MGAGLRDGVPSSPGDDQEALLFVEAAPALETHSASVSTSWRTYLGLYLVEVISKVIGTPHPGWLPIGRSVTKTASDLGITDTCAAQEDPPGDRHADPAGFSVQRCCAVLGVMPQRYYAYRHRPLSPTQPFGAPPSGRRPRCNARP